MDNNKIARLEKNEKFKKRIFSKNIWTNYAIFPPSLIMFVGVLGIIYLFNLDKLLSMYSIPFVGIFLLGTIWLKFTKKHLLDKYIKDSPSFLICLCIPLTTEKKNPILLFSTKKNRNNPYHLEKEKKDILDQEDINSIISNLSNNAQQINNSGIWITKLPTTKRFSGSKSNQYWVIYTGNNNSLKFITKSEIEKISL